ncbi:MAG: hypothetical protein ACM3UU_02785 [Ignavibacteriales bacterium]
MASNSLVEDTVMEQLVRQTSKVLIIVCDEISLDLRDRLSQSALYKVLESHGLPYEDGLGARIKKRLEENPEIYIVAFLAHKKCTCCMEQYFGDDQRMLEAFQLSFPSTGELVAHTAMMQAVDTAAKFNASLSRKSNVEVTTWFLDDITGEVSF